MASDTPPAVVRKYSEAARDLMLHTTASLRVRFDTHKQSNICEKACRPRWLPGSIAARAMHIPDAVLKCPLCTGSLAKGVFSSGIVLSGGIAALPPRNDR